MPPLAPFNQCSICESTLSEQLPYVITLRESVSGEEWEHELPADRGSMLASYLRQQMAAGQPFDRQQIVAILNG